MDPRTSTITHPHPLDNGAPIPVPEDAPDYVAWTLVCDNPACKCPDITLDLFEPNDECDDTITLRRARSGSVVFDTERDELKAERGSSDEYVTWLREHMTDKLRVRLKDRWIRQRAHVEHDPVRAFDWNDYRAGEMIPYAALWPHDWDIVVRDEGELYVLHDHHCPNPDCGCRDVMIHVSRLGDSRLEEVGTVRVTLDRPRKPKEVTGDPTAVRVWHRAFETELPRTELRARRADVKDVYAEAVAEGVFRPESLSFGTVRRTQRKVGRNEPCPCGSGKKYKRCCLRRGADASPSSAAAML